MGRFVFARVYPQRLAWVVGALLVIAVLLLLGYWHFLSDILAGMFLGALAGTLAGELAKSHFRKNRTQGG